jgi:hypothetical protein
MTGQLFEKWVRKLDGQCRLRNQTICLLLDNCPAHPKINGLQNVRLHFLPPNTTAKLQPCNQGIISNFKHYYRSLVLQKLIINMESTTEFNPASDFKFSLLDALRCVRSAWLAVTATTITVSGMLVLCCPVTVPQTSTKNQTQPRESFKLCLLQQVH